MAFVLINPFLQFFDNAGEVLDGGKLFVYEPGTSTKTTTWVNEDHSAENTNPIILNSAGRCTIFVSDGVEYKLVLAHADDTDPPTSPIRTIDEVRSPISTESAIGAILHPRTLPEIAAGLTVADNTIPSPDVTGGVVIPSRYAVNAIPGTTDMTATLNALADMCRNNALTLQLEPQMCLVSASLDFSGIVVDGLGFNLDGDPHIRATSAQFDVVKSTGRTVLRNVFIDGGWDGSTAGQSGDAISLIDTGAAGTAYDILLDNVAVFNAKKRGIYWEGAGYGRINRPQVSGCGLHALEIYSVDSGHVSTTVQVTGKGSLSSTPNGYGVKLTQCVDIAIDHVVMEATNGVQINGSDNRSISLNHCYQESGVGANFLTCGTSDGIGLSVTNCVGGNLVIPYPTNWQGVHYASNSLLTESAVPLAGHIIQADGGTLTTTTTGGVDVTAASIVLPPGTYIITGTVQTLTATATSGTQAACCLTVTVGDSGLANQTDSTFKIGADQANYSAGAGLDHRLNCLLPYQNTTSGNVTIYLRAKFTYSGAGTLSYRGFINALKVQ